MDPTLYDINLRELEEGYLHGAWRVRSRVPGPTTDPDHSLMRATNVTLDFTQTLRLEGTASSGDVSVTSTAGRWAMERDPLLSRPWLTLELPEGATRALVTRLRRSADGATRQLSLYTQAGLELFLTHP